MRDIEDDQPEFPEWYAKFVDDMVATNSGTIMDEVYLQRRKTMQDSDRAQSFMAKTRLRA